jgi:hypothetical protein
MPKSLLISDFSQSMLSAPVAAGAQVSSADGTRKLTREELALISGGTIYFPYPIFPSPLCLSLRRVS